MTSSTQPLIGITSGLTRNQAGSTLCQVGQAYITAIQNAGGTPIIIPVEIDAQSIENLLARVDGLLFTGGGDIDPLLFNGDPHPRVYGISPERDLLELTLIKRALQVEKPLLAICRGIQVLNVALGGTLHTHIKDQLPNAMKHDYFPGFPRDKLAHTISLTCGSKLQKILGADDVQVNSLHHQGIARLGKGLSATAYAPDGLVEGVEVEGVNFALGVQWHPECMPEDVKMQGIFSALINASERPSR